MDTYDNDASGDTPAIYVIKNNGQQVQWDYGTDLKPSHIASCQSNYRNPINGKVKMKIRYDGGVLTTSLDTLDNGDFTPCFTIPILLEPGLHLALTAQTGGLTDFHDVIELDTYDLNADQKTSEHQYHERIGKGRWDPYEFYIEEMKREKENKEKGDAQHQAEHNLHGYGSVNTEKKADLNSGDNINLNRHERYLRHQQGKDETNPPAAPEPVKKTPPAKATPPARAPRGKQNPTPRTKTSPPTPPPSNGNDQEANFLENLRKKLRNLGVDEETIDQAVNSQMNTGRGRRNQNHPSISEKSTRKILEAVEKTCSKADLKDLADQITQIVKTEARTASGMQEIKQHINTEVGKAVSLLREETEHLKREISKLDAILNGVSGHLGDIKSSQTQVHNTIQQHTKDVTTVISSSKGSNFWLYFLILISIFAAFLFVYKKSLQRKKRYL